MGNNDPRPTAPRTNEDGPRDDNNPEPTVVAPEAPSAGVSTSSEAGSHTYHEVAEGVEARASTEAERQARNAQAASEISAQN